MPILCDLSALFGGFFLCFFTLVPATSCLHLHTSKYFFLFDEQSYQQPVYLVRSDLFRFFLRLLPPEAHVFLIINEHYVLFYCNTFSQIPRFIYIKAFCYTQIVTQ